MSLAVEIAVHTKTAVPFHRIGSPGSLALVSVGVERMSMLPRNFQSFILFFLRCPSSK